MAATVSGVILYYLESKHFGYIERNHKRYFFHRNDIDDIRSKGDPLDGQFVRFEETGNAKGPKAIHVTRVPETSSEVRYRLADGFNIFRNPKGEQRNLLLAVADWTVCYKAKGSYSGVQRQFYDEVKRLGGNGILDNPTYGTEQHTLGNYIYNVHCFIGRPCLIGKKSASGLQFSELSSLNASLERRYSTAQPDDTGTEKYVPWGWYISALLLIIFGFAGMYVLAPLGFFVAFLGFIRSSQVNFRGKTDYKPQTIVRYVPADSHKYAVYKPKPKPETRSEPQLCSEE
jgi:cold shock CspA family protein